MNYRLLTVTFLALFLSGMLWTARQNAKAGSRVNTEAIARDMSAPEESLSEATAPPRHFTAHDAQGAVSGHILFTAELAPEVQGYGGRIPLAVRINATGQIHSIRALENNETPSYVGDLDLYVLQFVGKKSSDPLELRKDIDTIARATITSDAIARSIKKSLAAFTGTNTASSSSAKPFPWDKTIFSLLTFGLGLAAILTANPRLRWLAMTAGFIYFGLITSTMLSVTQVIHVGLLHIPDFITNPLWWLTLVFAFASALVIGRAHCATVCPFALAQEILYKLLRRQSAVPRVDAQLDQQTRYLKYFFLFIIIVAAFLLGNTSAANVEPFVILFRGHGTKLAMTFLFMMLIFAIFYFRFWCVFLCPVGALTGIVSRFSLFRIKLTGQCSHCQICTDICPVRAISCKTSDVRRPTSGQSIDVDDAECILCGRCITGCPEGKLSLRGRNDKT